MTLREESLSTKEQPPFASTGSMISFMQSARDNIERLTQEFLRKGGKINSPVQQFVTPFVKKQMDEKRKKAIQSTRAQGSAILGIPHKKQITTTGKQNIHKASGDRFTVVVRSKSYGIYATIEEAVTVRDRVREESGMPKAEY